MSTIPGGMFVAPGSCHNSLRKYHQIQKRQQSKEINIKDAIPSASEVPGNPRKEMPGSPVGSPIGSPTLPQSPLNKMYMYLRRLSTSTTGTEFQASSLPHNFKFPPQGDDTNTSASESTSPLNSPRSDAEDA